MKNILRFLVALVFIASGFVKAVDVVGFSFKLEEYFSPAVFNIGFLESLALPIAIVVVVLELVLGCMLLLKIKVKPVLALMIALCVFFAFLTFYSAYFNKVTDCGCFGDAIKFTPWQSFIKDIILLFALILLWLGYKNEKKSKPSNLQNGLLGLGILATAFIVFWGFSNEPLIDFRDYKIGTDMKAEKQKLLKNPSEYKTFYVLKNKKSGEEKEVNQDDYVNDASLWSEGTPWEIVSDKTTSKIVKQGYKTEIAKFYVEDENGTDLTDQIINAPKAVLLYSYKPDKADKELIAKVEEKIASEKNILSLGISPVIGTFKKLKNAKMDATASKTIARSNPYVLILENGKIIDKMPAKNYVN